MDGMYVKDLRIFKNRDISSLVIVDNALQSFVNQMNNGIPIIPYYDNKDDRELKYLKKLLL